MLEYIFKKKNNHLTRIKTNYCYNEFCCLLLGTSLILHINLVLLFKSFVLFDRPELVNKKNIYLGPTLSRFKEEQIFKKKKCTYTSFVEDLS